MPYTEPGRRKRRQLESICVLCYCKAGSLLPRRPLQLLNAYYIYNDEQQFHLIV